MPDRTKEQLQQIYDDLAAVREVVNQLHDMGELWPTPMNGKTWEEEKNEYYFSGINMMTDLIRSGKIKSCEVLSCYEGWAQVLRDRRNQTGFWNHYGRQYYSSSDKVINNSSTSIDELTQELNLAKQGVLSIERIRQLNEDIDSLGNCSYEPRAMMENSGKSDRVDNNVSLPKANGVNCHFRA